MTQDLAGKSQTVSVLLEAWRMVAGTETEALKSVSFADLVERSRLATDPMYSI